MAKLIANLALDYTQLDISGLQESTNSGFDDNLNVVINGITYQDVVWFEDGFESTGFAGTNITMNVDVVTGGTITGVFADYWTGSGFTRAWQLEGIGVGAVSIYNAAMTAGTTDDFNLVAKTLAGADTFELSNFADKVRGYGGNDLLKGMRGNDTMLGDAGNDTLVGGLGRDTMTGNAGADVFDFNVANESTLAARDVITDFTRGVDKLDLSGIDANSAAATNQAFTGFIAASAGFTRAGQLKFVDGVLFGNTDADAAAEFAIVLTGVTGLSVANLVL